MSTPSGSDDPNGPAAEQPFDPYRFGKPDRPVPPEYAPPGYVPDRPVSPYAGASNTPPGQLGGRFPGQPWPPPMGQYPGPGYAPVPQQGSNGKAIAAMVLGIVSIIMFWMSIFNGVLIVLALVFGILGLSEAGRRGGAGRAMAITGLVCMAVGTVLTVIYTVLVLNATSACGGLDNRDDPGFSQCVQNHVF